TLLARRNAGRVPDCDGRKQTEPARYGKKNNTDRHGKSSAMKCQISETLVCWAAQLARGKPTPTAQGAPSQIISAAFREISDSATFHFCTGFVRGSLWHERSS